MYDENGNLIGGGRDGRFGNTGDSFFSGGA
jgi:hypothetical protein